MNKYDKFDNFEEMLEDFYDRLIAAKEAKDQDAVKNLIIEISAIQKALTEEESN